MALPSKLSSIIVVLFFLLIHVCIQTCITTKERGKQPNIVILLVDDLGIGDIGCFGNTTIKTPNIDQIARNGALFEHNLSPGMLCTPSRAALLTGRQAIRSGMVAEKGDPRVFINSAIQGGLPQNEVTFAKILQKYGYRTALIGKWHLGLSCNTSRDFCHHPNNHGFHHFYGLPLSNFRECGYDWGTEINNFDKNLAIIATSIIVLLSILHIGKCSMKVCVFALVYLVLVLNFYISSVTRVIMYKWFSCMLMRNDEVVEQPLLLEGLTQRFVSEAVHFIEENQDRPFLLLMSFAKVHTSLHTNDYFVNHSKHGRYGDNVEEMDWAVGKILGKIGDLHLQNDTFVLFTSDHGPAIDEVSRDGELMGGFQGIFRDGKWTNFEGGLRVPTLAKWPNKIPFGTRITIPTSSLDIFPTILNIAGAEQPKNIHLDGKDILETMMGIENPLESQRFILHYCDRSIQAATYADYKRAKIWKIHFAVSKVAIDRSCYGDGVDHYEQPLVFELGVDPREQIPIGRNNSVLESVLQEAKEAMRMHSASVKPVQSQLSLQKFYPWMQLCCNPPMCYCREQFPHELVSIP